MDFLYSIAEEKIRESMCKGEFDNLPGAGKPLPPDDMASVPEDLRVAYKLLKNAGMVPEELQLRKDMVTLGELIEVCRDDAERVKFQNELAVKKLRYQMLMSKRGWHASHVFTEYGNQIERKLTSDTD